MEEVSCERAMRSTRPVANGRQRLVKDQSHQRCCIMSTSKVGVDGVKRLWQLLGGDSARLPPQLRNPPIPTCLTVLKRSRGGASH